METLELENMIIRLTGDGGSYQKMLQTAQQQTQQVAQVLQTATKQIEGMKESIEGFAKGVTGFAQSAVSLAAGYGIAASLGGAMEKYDQFNLTQIRLKASIEAMGLPLDQTLKQYKNLAVELEKNSALSKGEIYALIQKAQNMGKSGDALESIVKNSAAFAAITGQSAQESFRLANAFATGEVHMVKHALGLRGMKDDTQIMAIAQQRLAAGFKVMAEEAGLAPVMLEKLKRAFTGVTMEVGGLVSQGLNPLVKIMIQAVEQFKALPDETKHLIAYVTLATLAFMGLPTAISTVMFLMDALGITFAINTALQLANLAGWLVWTGVVFAAKVAIGLFTGLFALFNAGLLWGVTNLILSTAWWVISTAATWAWSLAVLAAKGVVALFNLALLATNTQLAIETAMAVGAAGGWIPYIVGIVGAKAATWLLNVALTAKNLLLAGIPIVVGAVVLAFTAFVGIITAATSGVFALVAGLLALVVMAGIATGAFFLIGVPILAAVLTTTQLYDLFASTPELLGPLSSISKVFMEWVGILKDVVKAAQVDLPLAWELLKAGFWLAVAEVKSLWPPLWAFIQEGFSILWDTIKVIGMSNLKLAPLALVAGFAIAVDSVLDILGKLWKFMKVGFEAALDVTGQIKMPSVQDVKDFVAGIGKELKAVPEKELEIQKEALANAQKRLADASKNFKAEDSPEVLAARAEVERIRGVVNQKVQDQAKNAGGQVGQAFNKGVKEHIQKLDLVLAGSAESLSRIAAYREHLAGNVVGAVAGGAGAVPAGAANNQPVPVQIQQPAGGGNDNPVVAVLIQIRDILTNKAKAAPIVLAPADFGANA